jgi:hypothetical protein
VPVRRAAAPSQEHRSRDGSTEPAMEAPAGANPPPATAGPRKDHDSFADWFSSALQNQRDPPTLAMLAQTPSKLADG